MPIALNDPAHVARCKRLRRALLLAAEVHASAASTGGWCHGYALRDMAVDPDAGAATLVGDNGLALALLRDLVRKALLEERPSPDTPLRPGQRFTLAHCQFRATDRGVRLLYEHEPIDPDIADLRAEVHP